MFASSYTQRCQIYMEEKVDTSIRSEGAEIYVQAFLMLEKGIAATLTNRNMTGYDV